MALCVFYEMSSCFQTRKVFCKQSGTILGWCTLKIVFTRVVIPKHSSPDVELTCYFFYRSKIVLLDLLEKS